MIDPAVAAVATQHPPVQIDGEPIVVWIDDPELAELIPLFLENRQKDLASLREAVAASDYAVLRRLGHNMKGTGAGYGLDGITHVGAALERAALDEDAARVRAAARALASYLDRVDIRFAPARDVARPAVRA